MSDEEIEAFLKLPPPFITRIDPRSNKTLLYRFDVKAWTVWTLFFKILAYSGMRSGEVAHLTIESVDFGRQVFILEDTKTNTPRFVPIAPALLEEISAYVKTLSGKYLFPSKKGSISTRQKAPVIDDTDWGYQFHKRLTLLGIKRKNLTLTRGHLNTRSLSHRHDRLYKGASKPCSWLSFRDRGKTLAGHAR
jgi:integrase